MQLRISHLAVRSTGLPCTGSHRARALRSPHDARACTCARPRWRAGTCSTSARRPAELEQGREHVRPVAFSTCTVSSACVSSRCRRRTRSGRCASSCRSRSSSARRSRASPARAHGTDHANVSGWRRQQQRDAGSRAGMASQRERSVHGRAAHRLDRIDHTTDETTLPKSARTPLTPRSYFLQASAEGQGGRVSAARAQEWARAYVRIRAMRTGCSRAVDITTCCTGARARFEANEGFIFLSREKDFAGKLRSKFQVRDA